MNDVTDNERQEERERNSFLQVFAAVEVVRAWDKRKLGLDRSTLELETSVELLAQALGMREQPARALTAAEVSK